MTAAEGTRFVLLFDDLKGVHLFKDVGQLPYQMHKHFGYQAEIVCRSGEERFTDLDGALQGLTVTRCAAGAYRYLLKYAREIDVLMLFHISTRTIYRGLLYKLLNPRGCLYVKTDMSGDSIRYARWGERNILTQLKRSWLFKRFVPQVDIVSFETELAYRGVAAIAPDKKLLIPNGFDPDLPRWYGVQRRSFSAKENIILLVSRHGDHAKNSELLLDALAAMEPLPGWQIWFVGPMDDGFIRRRDAFVQQHPAWRDQLVFCGQIDDKRELFEIYNRAKILCLTSRWESWGLVCVEAMAFGCVPVMTRVSSAADITANGTAGVIVDQEDAAMMAGALTELALSPHRLEALSGIAEDHFRARFVWKDCLAALDSKIHEVRVRTAAV